MVHRDGDTLTVRSGAPGALNARLVAGGIRVTELAAQRRSLEQGGAGTDGVGLGPGESPVIGVELRLMLRRRRVWLCWALPCALVAVLLAATDLVPAPGQGPAFLSAVVGNGQLYPAAALALVLPVFLPITVAIVAGD